ncbi:MAG: hypothetical protein ACREP7_16210, partial [Lysobacter sp.]
MSAGKGNRRGVAVAGTVLSAALACAIAGQAAAAKPSRQFWNSFEAAEAPPAPSDAGAMAIAVDGGPPAAAAPTAKAGVGFSGLRSLRYQGTGGA